MRTMTRLLLAAPVAAGLLAAPSMARADWHGWHVWRGGGWHGGWHGGHWNYWGPGAVVAGALAGIGVGALVAGAVAPPPPVYYPPPPAYYAPPPGYYAPPPAAYAPPPAYAPPAYQSPY